MTLALSHVAHEGRRWSQRFFLRRHLFTEVSQGSSTCNRGGDTDLLQAETLRKDEADETDAAGETGFTGSCGEAASPS